MIHIYAPHISNRLNYAFDLIFGQIAGLDYRISSEKESLPENDQFINYSGEELGGFQVHPCGLLNEKSIDWKDIPFEYRQDEFLVGVFPTEFDDLGFDLFSASFYFVSRYEEYQKFPADQHGRFTSDLSIQTKIGVLKRPIVNIWVKSLIEKLNVIWDVNFTIEREFQIINTIDVDVAFAHKAKGLIRTAGGIGKSLLKGQMTNVKDRLSSLSGGNDPYETYDYIKRICERNDIDSKCFLLLGDYKKPYDTSNDFKSAEYTAMVEFLSTFSNVGIHPSYNSYLQGAILNKEISRLNSFKTNDKLIARKHFLRLSIPDSYRLMNDAEITEDYTMGYADQVGFRAGICTPFKFFDVLQDKMLDIEIVPFAYMDGTLREYLKQDVSESIKIIDFLKTQVRNVNGQFIGIWHNTSLAEIEGWEGWRTVYEAGLAN